MPSVGQLEAADLVGRAVAVLHRAHQPQRRVPLALEVEDDVDQVLEHARPGDRAVLGHVADEHRRDAAAPWRRGSARPRTRGPARRRRARRRPRGARRSGSSRRRAARVDRVDVAEHGGQVGLRGEVERRGRARRCARRAAAPAHADSSPETISARDAVGAEAVRDLEQQRGLARRPARRPAAAPRRARGRRRAPGRARRCRSAGRAAACTSTSPIGSAAALTGPAATAARARRRPTSATVPQAWHSGQRPTHLAAVCPHSVQRYAGRAAVDFVAMTSR